MSLVEKKTVLKFLGLEELATEDKNLDLIISSVEAWIQTVYCRRAFEDVSYKERYDGTGTDTLLLDYYPIITLNRLSIGTDDAISVKNTNTGGHASVSVSSTVVSLYKDGSTTTLSLTTYSTMTLLVDAINAQSGWSAALMDSTIASFPSTFLLEKFGLQCIDNNYVYLQMPDEGEEDFEVFPKEGKIVLYSGFPEGTRNVFVDYSAGYAIIPSDLQLATLILIKHVYQKRSEESWGVANYSISGMSVTFEQDLPLQARQILNGYKRSLL